MVVSHAGHSPQSKFELLPISAAQAQIPKSQIGLANCRKNVKDIIEEAESLTAALEVINNANGRLVSQRKLNHVFNGFGHLSPHQVLALHERFPQIPQRNLVSLVMPKDVKETLCLIRGIEFKVGTKNNGTTDQDQVISPKIDLSSTTITTEIRSRIEEILKAIPTKTSELRRMRLAVDKIIKSIRPAKIRTSTLNSTPNRIKLFHLLNSEGKFKGNLGLETAKILHTKFNVPIEQVIACVPPSQRSKALLLIFGVELTAPVKVKSPPPESQKKVPRIKVFVKSPAELIQDSLDILLRYCDAAKGKIETLAKLLRIDPEKLTAKNPDDMLGPKQVLTAIRLSAGELNLTQALQLASDSKKVATMKLLEKRFPDKARRELPDLAHKIWDLGRQNLAEIRQPSAKWILSAYRATPGYQLESDQGDSSVFAMLDRSLGLPFGTFEQKILTGIMSLGKNQVLNLARLLFDYDISRTLNDAEIQSLASFVKGGLSKEKLLDLAKNYGLTELDQLTNRQIMEIATENKAIEWGESFIELRDDLGIYREEEGDFA
ncbi:MAG: hypothetical protein R3A13_00955 [Bdellovibrionota bacterium]